MKAKCPNCGKDIDLVGAKELSDDYGINANSLQYARDSGKFPEPWVSFGNRNVWLREDVEKFVSERGKEKVESTVRDLLKTLENLPDSDRTTTIEELNKQLGK